MIPASKLDKIDNALITGMALEDAYIYAGLSEAEIVEITEDEEQQLAYRQVIKEFEYGLLRDLRQVADKQIRLGKEGALTWMLEKMFPRYSNKPTSVLPDIKIVMPDTDPVNMDTVVIKNGVEDGGNSTN